MSRRLQILEKDPRLAGLKEACLAGDTPVYLHGMLSESLYQVGLYLFGAAKRPVFLVYEDELQAKNAAANAAQWLEDDVLYFPSREVHFYDIDAVENQNEALRLKAMSRLAAGDFFVVCTTLRALAEKITTPQGFLRDCITIDAQSRIDLEELRRQLTYLRYQAVPRVESSGEFAVRGGIVDIFPPNRERPVRIELFDTDVDSLRTFDIATQRSVDTLDAVYIGPAKDMLLDSRDVDAILKGLKKDLSRYENKYLHGVNKERALEKFGQLAEQVSVGQAASNMHLLLPYLPKEGTAGLLDYLPKDALVLTDDLSRVYDRFLQQNDEMLEQLTADIEAGEAFPIHEHIWYSAADVMERMKARRMVNASQLMKRVRLVNPRRIFEVKTLETENFGGQMENFFARLKEWRQEGVTVLLALGTPERKELMQAELYARNIPASDTGADTLPEGIVLSTLSLSQGIYYPDAGFTLVTHKEIYGRAKITGDRKRRRKPKSVMKTTDLTPGDYVVHENHGIGRFEGFRQLTVDENTRDYLLIQYRGNDRLYIPTDQLQLIQKYIGQKDTTKGPRLNRLNSPEWRRTKSRAKKAVEEIAEDLILLYAKRAQQKGHAFAPDTPWQREFEENFIFEETASQLRSIAEIKKDMENERPMDRLLCGDVGYGKTEVALRAAFKAVMDGKQVALLCPTTILAQQHFQTAKERFRDFPVNVDVISRFRTPADGRRVLAQTRRGELDVLVGTHRILSDDLKFKDLGLLIVDEEQRFGVRHKEKLKAMAAQVDVLTLSATPIPRTLQMGLIGIRDMSVLDEPPEERFPTTTYVLEYDRGIMASAMQRELDRGGQIYFVYNRVYDIDKMALELQQMLPHARIGVGHGQMPERQLEEVMRQFIEKETDILLSTTIIETGLDIQNVNTMIVYDADRMGLAQMYQLKGRIGRSNRTSYAYFTYAKDKVLQETAEKRLMAIRDFSEFGSGYKIAMRDLELRGAGNLLGESQSGHIEAIGYDLYVKYLEEAVRKARGEETVQSADVEMDIVLDGYIPADYISDNDQKMEAYKHIASIETEEDFTLIVEELIDRFGDIPPSVYNIILAARLKSLAAAIGFTRITEQGSEMVFSFPDNQLFSLEEIARISMAYKGRAVFNLSEETLIRFSWSRDKLEESLQFLGEINKIKEKKEN